MRMPLRSAVVPSAPSRVASTGHVRNSAHCYTSRAQRISVPMKPCAPSSAAAADKPPAPHPILLPELRSRKSADARRLCESAQYLHSLASWPCGRRDLLGAVPLGHVDNSLHWRGQLVDVTHIGEVTLRYPAKRLGRDAIEQDQTEVAVWPARRLAGVEFFPAKMKNRIRPLSRHFPLRDDVRVLSNQRQPLVRM